MPGGGDEGPYIGATVELDGVDPSRELGPAAAEARTGARRPASEHGARVPGGQYCAAGREVNGEIHTHAHRERVCVCRDRETETDRLRTDGWGSHLRVAGDVRHWGAARGALGMGCHVVTPILQHTAATHTWELADGSAMAVMSISS